MGIMPIIVTASGMLYVTEGEGSEGYENMKREAALTLQHYGLEGIVSWYMAVWGSQPVTRRGSKVKQLIPPRDFVLSIQHPTLMRTEGSVERAYLIKEITRHLTDNRLRLNSGLDLIVCQQIYLPQVQQAAAAQGIETNVLTNA
jgi:hypothetical protein